MKNNFDEKRKFQEDKFQEHKKISYISQYLKEPRLQYFYTLRIQIYLRNIISLNKGSSEKNAIDNLNCSKQLTNYSNDLLIITTQDFCILDLHKQNQQNQRYHIKILHLLAKQYLV
ncbi:hypothetical protein pb186bvf_018674 [Paramecium bursaria]